MKISEMKVGKIYYVTGTSVIGIVKATAPDVTQSEIDRITIGNGKVIWGYWGIIFSTKLIEAHKTMQEAYKALQGMEAAHRKQFLLEKDTETIRPLTKKEEAQILFGAL